MNPAQLIGLAARHGVAVYLKPDGIPAMRPMRPGAKLPEKIERQIRSSRDMIIGWLKSAAKAPEKGDVCAGRLVAVSPHVAELVCACFVCENGSCRHPVSAPTAPEGVLPCDLTT